MSLSDRLNCRIDVYGKAQTENELNEMDFEYRKIKSIWAEITPQTGREVNKKGNTLYSEVSHKFTIRINAIKKLTNDMYFVFRDQRYDIKYYNPNYKYRNCIDVFCILVIENE